MENNKRFLAVLLTIALSGVLAACGNSSEESSSHPSNNSSAQEETTEKEPDGSQGIEEEKTDGSSNTTQSHDKDDSAEAPNDVEAVDKNESPESIKDEYLKKLNKMEEADRNAEAKTTTAEMVKQEEERYRTWDDELNKIYGLLEEQLENDQMNQLREEQRKWIQQRDETAKNSSLKYKGGSMEQLEYVAALASLTRERCYLLVAKYMN
ncbi:lysozyme inhibitor LprI family protein [Cytobacillus sp. FSL H8-0458]|uniref:lysozyme inhibitor LprI family protein n=1 Tax=Cytobacillus sp. FSL H8-0458 TaxID=2975346 RepID=UPI0030F6BFAD